MSDVLAEKLDEGETATADGVRAQDAGWARKLRATADLIATTAIDRRARPHNPSGRLLFPVDASSRRS